MDTIHKSNSKRTGNILLAKNKEIYDIGDDADSDLNSEYDLIVTESDDTSTNEHISEESDSSNSDIDQSDIPIDIQPETLQKVGVTWSKHSVLVKDRISAANIMKQKPGAITTVQSNLDAFKLLFLRMRSLMKLFFIQITTLNDIFIKLKDYDKVLIL
ncbi:unnamed protein product [Rotaria socialis]|uniref:Uncharacterized protein n=1 Tax=Rotaria socialis TaxID=392032 RepID=A0A817ZUF7_9BILA|nr:unnamed protein product [Rotaria socialis]CAF3397687.1 unnamed protein product [Rotaria socialis]CAF3696782.1 unnamed protein product [Rotaria socialis]CAF3759072.1 unnamed protein product [Rotaria socialis]CAF4228665.1 unnamed protein product [Rotaria socialis]